MRRGVLLVTLAGCTAVPPSGSSKPSESTPGPCTERGHRTVVPDRPSLTPSSLPEPPSTLTEQSVRDFVVRYEGAYRRNHELHADTRRVSTDVSVESVSTWRDGYLVTVSSWASGYDSAVTTSSETATVLHWVGPGYQVAYFVTGDRLGRQGVDAEETTAVDPGVLVRLASRSGR